MLEPGSQTGSPIEPRWDDRDNWLDRAYEILAGFVIFLVPGMALSAIVVAIFGFSWFGCYGMMMAAGAAGSFIARKLS